MCTLRNWNTSVYCKVRVSCPDIAADSSNRAIDLLKDRILNETDVLNQEDPELSITTNFIDFISGQHTAALNGSIPQGVIEESEEMLDELADCKSLLTTLLGTLTPSTPNHTATQQQIANISLIQERIDRKNG